ncbi:hypothetical protein ABK040_015708 [Willaertia magna]
MCTESYKVLLKEWSESKKDDEDIYEYLLDKYNEKDITKPAEYNDFEKFVCSLCLEFVVLFDVDIVIDTFILLLNNYNFHKQELLNYVYDMKANEKLTYDFENLLVDLIN